MDLAKFLAVAAGMAIRATVNKTPTNFTPRATIRATANK